MSPQADYVVSNGTGAAVRSDINGQLAAIVSNNSGASAPATTYAYMLWADTSTNLLKLRNGANSAWITVGDLTAANLGLATLASPTFTGTATIPTLTVSTAANIPLGSAASPTLYFTGDSNTGLYSPGADQVAISTGGSGRLFINSAGRVGIGVSSPAAPLDVAGGWIQSDQSYGVSLGTYGPTGSSPNQSYLKSNSTLVELSGTDSIVFRTNGGTEAARLTSAGRLGIGTSPSTLLHLASADPVIRLQDTDTNGYGQITVDNGGSVYIQADEANTQASSSIRLNVDGSERARIDSSGRLLVGTSTALTNFKWGGSGDFSTSVQFEGTSSNRDIGLALVNHNTNDTSAVLRLAKSRGTAASPTVVSSGDFTGSIQFMGYDGTRYIDTARIDSYVDGGCGANDMPGSLSFLTTADAGSIVTERMRIYGNGAVAISSSPYLYPVTDNATKLGLSGYRWSEVWAANGTIQTSDKRTKTNIANATLGSDFIKSLRPVSYKWIEGGKRDTGKRDENNNYIYESVPGERTHWGFIAQEVKEATDAAGVDFGGWILTDKDDPDSQQALRYDQFIAPLTKALQEALAEIDVLKTKVAALESA